MSRSLKRILIAVDDSDATDAAVAEGLALAAHDGAEVVFAYVAGTIGEEFVPRGNQPARVPRAADSVVLTSAEARAADAGVVCTSEFLVGYPPKQLALVADDLDVDLIVIGSRHLKGIRRALLGSTSRALLTESTRPVLVVPYVPAEDA